MEVAATAHAESNGSGGQSYSIFQQPWWLEAVAPGHWGEVRVEREGTILARMPYVIKKKCGLTLLSTPPLTNRLGPWLRPPQGKYATRLSEENELMTELIEKLPRFDLFAQNFMPEISNWFPFYLQGFQQTTNYTYRFADLTNLQSIWSDFHQNDIRSRIRKAEKVVSVRTDLGIDRLLEMLAKTFRRQGLPQPYDREMVCRIDAACGQRGCRQMFFAEDAKGNIHSAAYVVWDSSHAYGLMSGSDPALRNSGASDLLNWVVIQFAAQVTKAFDFNGSMIPPVERHFRKYGARQVPYFRVSKMSRRMKALNAGREFWQAVQGK
jgi:Acetyltransferase (GNAT) domain